MSENNQKQQPQQQQQQPLVRRARFPKAQPNIGTSTGIARIRRLSGHYTNENEIVDGNNTIKHQNSPLANNENQNSYLRSNSIKLNELNNENSLSQDKFDKEYDQQRTPTAAASTANVTTIQSIAVPTPTTTTTAAAATTSVSFNTTASNLDLFNADSNHSIMSATTAATFTSNYNPKFTKEHIMNIIKHKAMQKLKKIESDRLKEKRKSYKPVVDIENIDKSKLKMRDLLYYNPKTTQTRKSSVSEELIINENGRLDLDTTIMSHDGLSSRTTSRSQSEIDPPTPAPPPPPPAASAPQLIIGEDGSIVLNEESLIINRVGLERTNAIVEHESNDNLTYNSYRKFHHTKKWSKKETIRFYKALTMIGSDFTMIKRLFPNRSRDEIKRKFKREEKLNQALIDKIMCSKSAPIELSVFVGDDNEEDDDEEATNNKKESTENDSTKIKQPYDRYRAKRSRKRAFVESDSEINATTTTNVTVTAGGDATTTTTTIEQKKEEKKQKRKKPTKLINPNEPNTAKTSEEISKNILDTINSVIQNLNINEEKSSETSISDREDDQNDDLCVKADSSNDAITREQVNKIEENIKATVENMLNEVKYNEINDNRKEIIEEIKVESPPVPALIDKKNASNNEQMKTSIHNIMNEIDDSNGDEIELVFDLDTDVIEISKQSPSPQQQQQPVDDVHMLTTQQQDTHNYMIQQENNSQNNNTNANTNNDDEMYILDLDSKQTIKQKKDDFICNNNNNTTTTDLITNQHQQQQQATTSLVLNENNDSNQLIFVADDTSTGGNNREFHVHMITTTTTQPEVIIDDLSVQQDVPVPQQQQQQIGEDRSTPDVVVIETQSNNEPTAQVNRPQLTENQLVFVTDGNNDNNSDGSSNNNNNNNREFHVHMITSANNNTQVTTCTSTRSNSQIVISRKIKPSEATPTAPSPNTTTQPPCATQPQASPTQNTDNSTQPTTSSTQSSAAQNTANNKYFKSRLKFTPKVNK